MAYANTDIISPDKATTLDSLFRQRVASSPEAIAYRQFDRGAGLWEDTSWRDMAQAVARWQAAMAQEDLSAGDRVAIMLRNRREWVMFDQAAIGLGLVTVPLYPDDRPDNVAYILADSGARLLLVRDGKAWQSLAEACADLVALGRVVILEHPPAAPDPRVRTLEDWLPAGTGELKPRAGDPDNLATIVYTSGTTGRSKGVMLSHRNILSNAYASLLSISVRTDDLFLSFLPLSHMLERTAGYYLPMMAGATVAYARSIPELGEDLVHVRPSVLISVPRIYERVYARVQGQLETKGPLARALFRAAVAVGWSRFEHVQGRGPARPSHLVWPLLRALVARKIMAKLGGRLRIAVCGGAALSPEIARLFVGLGLPLVQGYGLTETSPVVSANRLPDNIPASIGTPIPEVSVRIGEDDELLVKGPNVMLGYWNNPAATHDIISGDGWLHTGDKVRIEGGHLYITGRIKEIIVMANGEKVPPADLELAIAMDPLFDQVMIIGEGRPFLTALLCVNPEQWRKVALAPDLDNGDPLASDDPVVEEFLLERIGVLMHDFPGYARIRHVTACLEPWTVESGFITPTMKLKRVRLLEHFAPQVQRMYRGHTP